MTIRCGIWNGRGTRGNQVGGDVMIMVDLLSNKNIPRKSGRRDDVDGARVCCRDAERKETPLQQLR